MTSYLDFMGVHAKCSIQTSILQLNKSLLGCGLFGCELVGFGLGLEDDPGFDISSDPEEVLEVT
jgi:hypothetical protein